MHGMIGGPYYKGKGPSGTNSAPEHNTVHNSPGCCGESMPQQPISGPERTGGPIALKRALAKKPTTGGRGPGLPSKNTSAPGSVR